MTAPGERPRQRGLPATLLSTLPATLPAAVPSTLQSPVPTPKRRPQGPAGVFVELAGVLLDATPSHGQLPGLRGGVGAALRLLDRLDYRIIALAPCSLDRRQASHLLP